MILALVVAVIAIMVFYKPDTATPATGPNFVISKTGHTLFVSNSGDVTGTTKIHRKRRIWWSRGSKAVHQRLSPISVRVPAHTRVSIAFPRPPAGSFRVCIAAKNGGSSSNACNRPFGS